MTSKKSRAKKAASNDQKPSNATTSKQSKKKYKKAHVKKASLIANQTSVLHTSAEFLQNKISALTGTDKVKKKPNKNSRIGSLPKAKPQKSAERQLEDEREADRKDYNKFVAKGGDPAEWRSARQRVEDLLVNGSKGLKERAEEDTSEGECCESSDDDGEDTEESEEKENHPAAKKV